MAFFALVGTWLALAVAMVRDLAGALRGLPRRHRAGALCAFAGLFTVAWLLRAQIVPHHVMYLDEPWYLEAARTLRPGHPAVLCAETWRGLRCEPYRKALGWPVLLALAGVPGPSADFASIRLTTVLGALCAPVAAWVARVARTSWPVAVLVGIAVALHPLHTAWSATSETHVPGALLLLVGMGLLTRAIETLDLTTAAGACAAFALAASIRPEEGIALVTSTAVLTWAQPTPRARATVVAIALVAAGVSLAALRPMWALNAEMSHGGFFALGRLPGSIRAMVNFGSARALAVCALGSALGLVGLAREKLRGPTAVLAGVVLPVWALVLCFDRFQERMLVGVSVAALPLAGVGVEALVGTARPWLRALGLTAMLVWLAVLARASFQWQITQHPPETQTLETRFASVVSHTVHVGWIVAEWPTVYAASASVPVMSSHEALQRGVGALVAAASQRPIYVAEDMYCEPHYAGLDHSACTDLIQALELQPVATESLHAHRFTLARIRGLRAPQP